MYGLVNKAVEDLVISGFGEETWEVVKVKAGVEEEVFISNQTYPDEVTFNLVAAASEVLDLPVSEILISFGEHWVLKTAVESYGPMMEQPVHRAEFRHLPHFHTRAPHLPSASSFECRMWREFRIALPHASISHQLCCRTRQIRKVF